MPNVLFNFYAAVLANNKVLSLTHLTEDFSSSPRFTLLLQPLTQFVNQYLIGFCIVVLLIGSTYFGLLEISLDHFRKNQTSSPISYMVKGLKTFIKRSLSFIAVAVIIMILAQWMAILAIGVCLLLIMAPVRIMATPAEKTLPIVWSTITISYTESNRFRAFTQIITLASSYFFLLLLFNWIIETLAHMDGILGLPRFTATIGNNGQQIPVVFLGATVVKAMISAFLTSLLALMSTKLYLDFLTADSHFPT